ncbi:MAG TPA: hypothetical protein VKW78_06635 [Terriglobales bacterium]|nr:hypothetical protein [Terriglobales bacterium]
MIFASVDAGTVAGAGGSGAVVVVENTEYENGFTGVPFDQPPIPFTTL